MFFIFILPLTSYSLERYAGVERVENTKHNLSTSGPGPIKATIEEQICIFCHTPHSAVSIPLWNHTLSSASYILPSKTITRLSIPQNPPDGDSRLCLSCHDGTVAIGSIVNLGGAATTISMQDTGTGYLTPEGMLSESAPGFIGTDLSGHHPVSIEVNPALINDKDTQCINNEVSFRLCYPQKPVVLRPTDNRYGAGPSTGVGVQCSSCHDSHDNIYGYFLRTLEDALCKKCHVRCFSGCP
ncbi:MAG: cytochrome c3 family protein [Nitrospirae bacterium]|nr:cytochrome c3 family protein [Nitrospirota bacterium]